jgi:hypothetical protein
MERPPSPPGPRTCATTARPNVFSPINTPPHWTSVPRATSDLRPPTNYVAAVMTTTQASFYKPLHKHKNYDNPFHVDSEDKDEPQSPVLLTNPAGVDTAVANTTDAATLGIEDAPTGKAIVKTMDTAPTADPPNEVTPAMKASIVSAVVDALKSAMEIHLSPINSHLKGMQSDISSNHGHITKHLFPDLEAKLTTLNGALDSKTRELDAKGESLLAKITSLDSRIATDVGKKIANLETKVEVATNNFDARIAALKSQGLEARPSTGLPQPKSPMAVVPVMAPAMMSEPEGDEDADFISPDDDTIDVTPCTHVAYANARERNSFLHAGPSSSQPQPRRGCSHVKNPYDALVAVPSNLSKYSDPEYFDVPSNLSNYSDPEYFDNHFTRTKSLCQTTILESFCHSEGVHGQNTQDTNIFTEGVHVQNTQDPNIFTNSNQDNSNRRSGDSVQGNRGGSRGSRQVVGGPIISPPHCDRAMHARTLGASCFDVIQLATKDYHGGMDGVVNLTEEDIRACSYGQVKAIAEDVVVCYNDIILAHCKDSELWHNGYTHTFGPQVDKIQQKSLSVFPRLESTRVDNVVAFYDHLQEVALGYIIAVIPFEAILLAHKFEGLCPPGLGLVKYAAMCKALMELLPWLIPSSLSPQVNATLTLVRYKSNNGYNYLWQVLELTVPGFDPTVPIHAPIWLGVKDIFQFAQAFLLFFRLQAKVKFHYDNRTQSGMFPQAVQFSEYADTVTTLQSHVNSFWQEYDNDYLPPHLRLHGLAISIHQNAQTRLRDIISPRVRRVLDDEFSFAHHTFNRDYSLVQGLPRANRLGWDDHPCRATRMANNDGYMAGAAMMTTTDTTSAPSLQMEHLHEDAVVPPVPQAV